MRVFVIAGFLWLSVSYVCPQESKAEDFEIPEIRTPREPKEHCEVGDFFVPDEQNRPNLFFYSDYKPYLNSRLKKTIERTHNYRNTDPQYRASDERVGSEVFPLRAIGKWSVNASRHSATSLPPYRAGLDNIFSMTKRFEIMLQNSDTINARIFSSEGNCTAESVAVLGKCISINCADKVKGTIKHTILLINLAGDGNTFEGLQTISVVGRDSVVRAEATYELHAKKDATPDTIFSNDDGKGGALIYKRPPKSESDAE